MWLRGGLAHANVAASMIFAGMSGSAVADAGGLGTIEMEAMKERGYDVDFAAAVTAASATVGPIIPPSLPMITYGVLADTSVGSLFAGGILPGILMGLSLMALVGWMAHKRNYPKEPFPTVASLWKAFREALWALLAPVILFGGIISGVFTPTEAAVVAAFYALILGLFIYREFKLRDLPKMILVTANVAKLSFERVTKANLPFLIPLLCVLLLVTLVPGLTTGLPRLILGR